MRLKHFSFFGIAALVACGGAIDDGLLDGGGDGASDSASSDGSASDAPTGVDTGGGPSCDNLENDLASETNAAETCCPTCDSVQCTAQVDGLCCPLTVDVATSDAVKAYEATLAQIKALGCSVNCPALACSSKPTGKCLQNGTCAQQ